MTEYKELSLNGDLAKRRDYWDVAKGLQATDGLTTSDYLDEVIKDTLEGRYDTAEAVIRVSKYYENADEGSLDKEADLSAAKITHILERGGFSFSPATLQAIHRELFTGVFQPEWVGAYRSQNITKKEDVLNGVSVQYADYSSIADTLAYDFAEQKKRIYHLPFDQEQINSIADFVSSIWQVHPFREGNTRTVATFTIMYLQNLGIDIDNDPFKEHAKFFRDALVRSNFASVKDGIAPDNSFLQMFFENVLAEADHDLESQDLNCKELFEDRNKGYAIAEKRTPANPQEQKPKSVSPKNDIAMGCEGARAASVDELASRATRRADERNRKLEHNSTMHNRRAR